MASLQTPLLAVLVLLAMALQETEAGEAGDTISTVSHFLTLSQMCPLLSVPTVPARSRYVSGNGGDGSTALPVHLSVC